MRTKQYHGFTLMEVVLALALIASIAAMVSVPMLSAIKSAGALPGITNKYYEAQNQVEEAINKLSPVVADWREKKNAWTNETDNTQRGALENEWKDKLNDLTTAGAPETNMYLLGKTVTVFPFQKNVSDDADVTLYAGIVDLEPAEFPVPAFKSVEIFESVDGRRNDLYFGISKTIQVKTEYDPTVNPTYQKSNGGVMYQWRYCSSNYHVTGYDGYTNGKLSMDRDDNVYANYPADTDVISGQTGNTLYLDDTLYDKLKGHFVLCVAVPVSKNGKLGEPMVSNYLYISALPDLELLGSSARYELLLDPSMETLSTTGLGYVGSISDCSNCWAPSVELCNRLTSNPAPLYQESTTGNGRVDVCLGFSHRISSGTEEAPSDTTGVMYSRSVQIWNQSKTYKFNSEVKNVVLFCVVRDGSFAVYSGESTYAGRKMDGDERVKTNMSLNENCHIEIVRLDQVKGSGDLEPYSYFSFKGDVAEIVVVKDMDLSLLNEKVAAKAIVDYLSEKYQNKHAIDSLKEWIDNAGVVVKNYT